jgi:hypothetical protein
MGHRMTKLLLAFAVLPLLASEGWAAQTLSDAEMDRVTGGTACAFGFSCSTEPAVQTTFACPTCTAGQVFRPTSPETFFGDLNTFLNSVGFPLK